MSFCATTGELLYHGTRSKLLDKILENGLKPRGKRKGNWKQYPSRHDLVYLTRSYAPFFAINGLKKNENLALILEIESSNLKLLPDEDFISQAISMNTGEPLPEVHKQVLENLESYQEHWQLSLDNLGNCSHKGPISPGNITRYCTLDIKKRPDLFSISLDPSISTMNYRFCGTRYQSIISWLFGDREDFDLMIGGNELYFQLHKPEIRKECEKMFLTREGIEVVQVKSKAA